MNTNSPLKEAIDSTLAAIVLVGFVIIAPVAYVVGFGVLVGIQVVGMGDS